MKIVILIFLIILISSMSLVSAATSYEIIKPAKETKLKNDGVRYTLPPSIAKPTSFENWRTKHYNFALSNGKIIAEVIKHQNSNEIGMYIKRDIYSNSITKVVLHLENQSFTGGSIKNLNSFTYTIIPPYDHNWAIYERVSVNASKTEDNDIFGRITGTYNYYTGAYTTGSSIDYSRSIYGSYPNLVAVDLYFAKESGSSSNNRADLTIPKITKKGNTHTVFIRNIGKASASKSILGVYDGKKLIKKANVKAIGKGKTVQVKVTLDRKFNTRIKTFRADYNNKIKESNKNNNIRRAK